MRLPRWSLGHLVATPRTNSWWPAAPMGWWTTPTSPSTKKAKTPVFSRFSYTSYHIMVINSTKWNQALYNCSKVAQPEGGSSCVHTWYEGAWEKSRHHHVYSTWQRKHDCSLWIHMVASCVPSENPSHANDGKRTNQAQMSQATWMSTTSWSLCRTWGTCRIGTRLLACSLGPTAWKHDPIMS